MIRSVSISKYLLVFSAISLLAIFTNSSISNAQFDNNAWNPSEPQAAVQRGAGIGIGTMCAGAITAFARNPSLETTINDNYEKALATLLTVPTKISAGEFSEAVGIIGGALVENISRNPSAEDQLVGFAERCIEDLMSLL